MQGSFFDLTQPVGLVETWVSITAVLLMMWLGFVAVKHAKKTQFKEKNQ